MTDHDGIYHQLYSNPHMMADLVRQFVTEPWVADLDFSRMEPVVTKFHVPGFPKRESDVIWQIQIKGGGELYLLFLLEFQSKVDRWMVLRVVVYTCLLWLQLLHEQRIPAQGPLPPVMPLVLYSGTSPWLMPVQLRDLINLPDDSPLWKFQPDGTFFLIDEGRYPKEALELRDSLSALVFQLEQCQNPEDLPELVAKVITWFERWPEFAGLKPVLAALFRNAVSALTEDPSVLSQPFDLLEVHAMLQANIETWKQKKRTEWIQEGEREGERRGKLEGEREGERRGKLEGKAEMLVRLLQHRFGDLPVWVHEKIAQANAVSLDDWGLRVLSTPTLEATLADQS